MTMTISPLLRVSKPNNIKRFTRKIALPVLHILALGGCAVRGYVIDPSIRSENQSSRVRNLVIHAMAMPLPLSIEILTKPRYKVSAHYLVPDQPMQGESVNRLFNIYRLVPEARRAWHAGLSFWQGEHLLNSGSIGIEIVNLGSPVEDQPLPPIARRWFAYPDDQFNAVAQLARDIVARHNIAPYKVVAHSDIAPQRKSDPGPLFPWKRLYKKYGVGAWPDEETVDLNMAQFPFDGDMLKLQRKLARYGYDVPQNGDNGDPATHAALAAFQMHFRPVKRDGVRGYDGLPDIETVAMLDALLQKYFGVQPGEDVMFETLTPSMFESRFMKDDKGNKAKSRKAPGVMP